MMLNGIWAASKMIVCYGQHGLYQDSLDSGCDMVWPLFVTIQKVVYPTHIPTLSSIPEPKWKSHHTFYPIMPYHTSWLSPALLVLLSWLGCVAIEWFYHHHDCPNRSDSVWFCEIKKNLWKLPISKVVHVSPVFFSIQHLAMDDLRGTSLRAALGGLAGLVESQGWNRAAFTFYPKVWIGNDRYGCIWIDNIYSIHIHAYRSSFKYDSLRFQFSLQHPPTKSGRWTLMNENDVVFECQRVRCFQPARDLKMSRWDHLRDSKKHQAGDNPI